MDSLFAALTAPTRTAETGVDRAVVDAGYLRGMRVAGLLPLVLSPLDDSETHSRLMDRAGALVLTGGEDVDPGLYGQKPDGARKVSPERDSMEFALLRSAIERGLPVLAICRGVQVLNVALGGSLYQDLATHFDDAIAHDRWNELDVSVHGVRPDTPELLKNVFNGSGSMQNSAHHQGIDRLADGLTPVAFAPDGLVEAVEYRVAAAWTVGVQWHPERKIDRDDGVNRRLFEAFGDAVRGVEPRSGLQLVR